MVVFQRDEAKPGPKALYQYRRPIQEAKDVKYRCARVTPSPNLRLPFPRAAPESGGHRRMAAEAASRK